MAFLGLFEPLTGQGGTGHPGVQHRVTVVFEPLFQETDMCRTAHAIGPLQYYKSAFQLPQIYIWKGFAKEVKSSHRLTLVFFVPVKASVTIPRTSACCSSMDRVASIATKPTPSTIFSSSWRTRSWKMRKLSSRSSLNARSMPAS